MQLGTGWIEIAKKHMPLDLVGKKLFPNPAPPQISHSTPMLGIKKAFLSSLSPHHIFRGSTKSNRVTMNCLIFRSTGSLQGFLSLPPLPAFPKRKAPVNLPAGLAGSERGNHMLPLSDSPHRSAFEGLSGRDCCCKDVSQMLQIFLANSSRPPPSSS